MKLRSGRNTMWPNVKNTMAKSSDWEGAKLGIMYAGTGRVRDTLYFRRTVTIKSCYILLNNKQFLREPEYQRVLKSMILKTSVIYDPPKYVCDIVSQIRLLTLESIAQRRWGVIKAASVFLGIQSRAVVTANHPSRLDFTVMD
jgi:hypothetical protein